MQLTRLDELADSIIQNPGHQDGAHAAELIFGLSPSQMPHLLACANRVRTHFKQSTVFTCGIVNAKSGRCSEDCAFCTQSSHYATGVETYALLDVQTLVERAIALKDRGATRYSMVSSGLKLSAPEIDTVCRATETIIAQTGMTICASLGTLTREEARRLRQSGVTNYHHNLETARSFFHQICTTHEYDRDVETIQTAAGAGMRVCAGGIFGLGETWQQRVELANTIRSLPVVSVPLNFLNPIAGTPLQERPLMSVMEALKCIALFRFLLPERDITICGGREVTLKDFQSWVFAAGANGLMVGNYLTTDGRKIEMDVDMIRESGLGLETD